MRAGAGTFVMVPPNLVHGFDNDSDATARWLNFHAPSTGFLGWMRGDRESFDMLPPPEGGGRSVDDAVIVRPGGGERYERSNRTISILGDEPQFSALDIAFDESFHVDPHEHDDHADSFFVLEGEVEFTVGDEAVRAGPGTWLSAPPGARHGFRNGGSGRARVLNVHAPDAGFADWIRDRSVRLGYACVNTQLPSSARTVRLANATPERLRELIAENLDALEAILRWNAEHDIAVFRLTSNLIPLASHPVNTLAWWDEFADRFDELARVLADAGARISTHPGQYTVLSSAKPAVVDAAIAELEYHERLLAALGLDRSHKIVLHVGSGAADPAAARARFAAAFGRLSDGARERLVLENDERWPLDRVLELAGPLGIPVVFDAFHHSLAPSFDGDAVRDVVLAAGETWDDGDGRQEVHFSTQDPGKRPGAHAQTIELERVRSVRRRGGRPAARLRPRGQGQGAVRPACARAAAHPRVKRVGEKTPASSHDGASPVSANAAAASPAAVV